MDAEGIIKFQCPHCQAVIEADYSKLGVQVGCGQCDNITVVPLFCFAPTVVINKYVIRRKLRDAAFGTRFLVQHLGANRELELTIVHDDVAQDKAVMERLIETAEKASFLDHPHLVRCFRYGSENNVHFLASEHISGGVSMRDMMRRQERFELRHAAAICKNVVEAMNYVWTESKMIHGNIKPSNIVVEGGNIGHLTSLVVSLVSQAMQGDGFLGTPYYVCPELLEQKPQDLSSDIYSLGAVLYHAVTGLPPFRGDDPEAIARLRLTESPTPVNEVVPELSAEAAWVIGKMMARRREERYQNLPLLIADLELLAQGEAPVSYPG